MTKLPPNPSRDDILTAPKDVPDGAPATRVELMRRFAAAPPKPGIKIRNGAKPGETEVWQNGCWIKEPVMARTRS